MEAPSVLEGRDRVDSFNSAASEQINSRGLGLSTAGGDSAELPAVPDESPIDNQGGNDSPSSKMPPPRLLTLRTLYIHEHGAIIRCEHEHLRVLKEEVEILSLPAFTI